MIEISAAQKTRYIETAQGLKGSERRIFMANVVQGLGRGGQRYAEKAFGWNRRTVRTGMAELRSGMRKVDRFSARGRKRVEERLPHLLDDLRAIVQGQTDAPLLARRLTAVEVRQSLIKQQGYCEEAVPCVATIRKKLKELGYGQR